MIGFLLSLLAIAILSLLSDLYIWMRYFSKKRAKRWLSIAYITQAVVLDVLLFVIFYKVNEIYGQQHGAEYGIMWLTWIIVLSFLPKLVFVVFLMVNDLLNKLFRRKWRFFEIVGGALVVLIVGLMVYGVTYGVSTIKVNRIIITSPKIPAAFDGYRIVHFSDLHIGNLAPSGKLLEDMIDTILSLKPDIIVNSGDLVHVVSEEITPERFRSLERLKAPDGVVSVLGNHDLGVYGSKDDNEILRNLHQIKDIQYLLGWRLLQNENISLKRNNDSISVAGVDYPSNGPYLGKRALETGCDLALAMRGVDTTRFSLLVSHTPSIWDSIPQVASPDLTISGHTHAMQMKLTVGKYRFSPAEFFHPEWSGIYVKNGLRLYVNDGVGYVVFPMRIGAPPEVTMYELRKSDS